MLYIKLCFGLKAIVQKNSWSIRTSISDTDKEILTALLERYKEQDTWKPDLILTWRRFRTYDGHNELAEIRQKEQIIAKL